MGNWGVLRILVSKNHIALFQFLNFLWSADVINGFDIVQEGKKFVAIKLKP